MSQPAYGKAYPQELREQVVRLVQVSQRSVREVAAEFAISVDAVRRWVPQVERDQGPRKAGLSSTERAELVQLRRLKQVEMERESLAKAAAWCARETVAMPHGSSQSQARTRVSVPAPAWAECWGSPPACMVPVATESAGAGG